MPNLVDEKLVPNYNVLIVDDEQIILNIASDVLQGVGYKVDSTPDPQEAIDKLKKSKYDFLLTDIKMPGMDGMTLAKEAQTIDSDIGVLFMTGYASLDTAKEAIKAGAYDYIMKPFELSELRHAMAKAVAKKAKIEETSGSQDLKRLSDLMEVLYNVGDKDSLLKLSLGLALLNCNLQIGLIASWDQRSSNLELAATSNVKDGSFDTLTHQLRAEEAEKCFTMKSPLRCNGICENPFFTEITGMIPDVKAFSKYFDSSSGTVTLAVKSQKKFYILLTLQENAEEALNDRDLKLLSIILSLISLAAENIALFEESRQALSELEKLHDDIVNLEKVAAQGIMSAEIGHELNNFLSIVRSNFELMTHKAKIENITEIAKYTDNINKCLEQMTKFTMGLADAANLRTEKEEIQLNALIEDIISFLSPQKRFRKIGIGKQLDPSLPIITADPSQLTQLFYNILNNAAQALSNKHAAAIKIVTSYSDTEKKVLIEISDNGPGMSKELLEKAFNSRFTTKSEGHGFGLIVCSKVVSNHGGRIKVDRGPEGGTIFKIKFPVSSENAQEESQNPTSEAEAAEKAGT